MQAAFAKQAAKMHSTVCITTMLTVDMHVVLIAPPCTRLSIRIPQNLDIVVAVVKEGFTVYNMQAGLKLVLALKDCCDIMAMCKHNA